MCILSGCDYLPSIRGVGLKKAYKLLKLHDDVFSVLEAMRTDKKKKWPIPDGYYTGNIYMCKCIKSFIVKNINSFNRHIHS